MALKQPTNSTILTCGHTKYIREKIPIGMYWCKECKEWFFSPNGINSIN